MEPYLEHYDDGSAKVSGQYNGDVKVGIWSFFKKNGRKIMEAHFSDQGEPLFNFYFDARGSMIEQGFIVLPYPNGQTAEEGVVKNCLKQGLWTYYDQAGNKKIIGEHKNGLKHGQWSYFDADGNLECAGTFHKNQWHGTVEFYHKDGSVKERQEFVHGRIKHPTPA